MVYLHETSMLLFCFCFCFFFVFFKNCSFCWIYLEIHADFVSFVSSTFTYGILLTLSLLLNKNISCQTVISNIISSHNSVQDFVELSQKWTTAHLEPLTKIWVFDCNEFEECINYLTSCSEKYRCQLHETIQNFSCFHFKVVKISLFHTITVSHTVFVYQLV